MQIIIKDIINFVKDIYKNQMKMNIKSAPQIWGAFKIRKRYNIDDNKYIIK